MPLSTFTSVATIGERSEATPGLFNRVFSIISQNVDQLNIDALSTVTGLSTNTLQSESGNTLSLQSTILVGLYGAYLGANRSYNAAFFPGTTSAAKIQASLVSAAAAGIRTVFIPSTMLPYTPSLVTWFTAANLPLVRLIREGGPVDDYDPLAYGASGDGITDDSSALSNVVVAAAAQGTIVIYGRGSSSASVYLLRDTWRIPSNTKIVGEGWPVIRRASSFTGTGRRQLLVVNQTNFTENASGALTGRDSNIHIEGLIFDGNRSGNTKPVGDAPPWVNLQLSNVDNGTIQNCRIINSSDDGVVFEYCRYSSMRNVYAVNNAKAGIYFSGCEYVSGDQLYSSCSSSIATGQQGINVSTTWYSNFGLMQATGHGVGGTTYSGFRLARDNRYCSFDQLVASGNMGGAGMFIIDEAPGATPAIHGTTYNGTATYSCSYCNFGLVNMSQNSAVGFQSFKGDHNNFGTVVCSLNGNDGIILSGANSNRFGTVIAVSNGTLGANTYDGIKLGSYGTLSCISNTFDNVDVSDSQASATQRWGINESDSSSSWNVFHNFVSVGNVTGAATFQSTGGARLSGQLWGEPGSVIEPTYSFNSERSLGIYRSATSTIAQSYGTLDLTRALTSLGTSTLTAGTAINPSLAFGSEQSLGWYRSASSTMALSYGSLALSQGGITITAALGGDSWVFLNQSGVGGWKVMNQNNTGNLVFQQGATLFWQMALSTGTLLPMTDNAYGIGSSAFRLRDIYWASNARPVDGTALLPSYSFNSELSLGWYRSGVSTLALSYGSFNFNQARTVSMRTLAASSLTPSAANTNTIANECGFVIGGASGASFWINSGGTTYIFNSAISAANA